MEKGYLPARTTDLGLTYYDPILSVKIDFCPLAYPLLYPMYRSYPFRSHLYTNSSTSHPESYHYSNSVASNSFPASITDFVSMRVVHYKSCVQSGPDGHQPSPLSFSPKLYH